MRFLPGLNVLTRGLYALTHGLYALRLPLPSGLDLISHIVNVLSLTLNALRPSWSQRAHPRLLYVYLRSPIASTRSAIFSTW